jgi:hypothetical protein
MTVRVVNQDTVLQHSGRIVGSARERIWLTSPWITGNAIRLLLAEALPRVREGTLEVRIIYRLKEPSDLEITDVGALAALVADGCQVRFSRRLHAKVLLVDDRTALVSSSNLTVAAGYGPGQGGNARNEELGLLVEGEAELVTALEREFLAIWETAAAIGPDTVGMVLDLPSARSFAFAAIRDLSVGQYVTASDPDGGTVVGRIAEITAWNPTVPSLDAAGPVPPSAQPWVTWSRAGGTPVPLASLFSHPSKEHGFLTARSLRDERATFHVASVEVLRQTEGERLVSPQRPVAPGADVRRADAGLLQGLLGDGDVPIGTVHHHPEVEVRLRGGEVLALHLAILGMTGSGKSNALKVLIRNLLMDPAYADLRIVVIDTHGEYGATADGFGRDPVFLDVAVSRRRSVLEEGISKDVLGEKRRATELEEYVARVAGDLPEEATLPDLLSALEASLAAGEAPQPDKLQRFIAHARERDDLCLQPNEGGGIVREDGTVEDLAAPGLYIVDLRDTAELKVRAEKAATVIGHAFERAKRSRESGRTLIVVDEVQHYAPEQQTGWLAKVRSCADALLTVGTEGRKFGVGLAVSTQRPARVNKDVLSQCNTHMIFRVANADDLAAIRGSFEAASEALIRDLPGFDTGVCVVGGPALGMVTQVDVPLFTAGSARASVREGK